MLDTLSIRESFSGLVGVLPVNNGSIPTIPLSLQSSLSGYYIGNELDPMLDLATIFNTANAMDNYESLKDHLPLYEGSKTYSRGAVVHDTSITYRSLISENLGNDLSDTDSWEETSIFAEYLRTKMEGAALQTVQAVLQANKINSDSGKTLLNNSNLYNGLGAIREQIQKTGRFVGLRIRIKQSNVLFKIHKIATQFSEAQENIPIYLYRDGESMPIKVWLVNQVVSGNMETHSVDPYIERIGMSLGFGTYKLGYYEADINGSAIHKKVSFRLSNCSSCDAINRSIMSKYQPHLNVTPFYVPQDDLDLISQSQWANDQEEFAISETNFGLNAWFSLECDLTDFVLTYKTLFLNAYLAKLKDIFTREVSFTRRTNATSNNIKGLLLQTGGNAKTYNQDKGPKIFTDDSASEFQQAVLATMLDLSDIDSPCLPVVSGRRKIKIGSV